MIDEYLRMIVTIKHFFLLRFKKMEELMFTEEELREKRDKLNQYQQARGIIKAEKILDLGEKISKVSYSYNERNNVIFLKQKEQLTAILNLQLEKMSSLFKQEYERFKQTFQSDLKESINNYFYRIQDMEKGVRKYLSIIIFFLFLVV